MNYPESGKATLYEDAYHDPLPILAKIPATIDIAIERPATIAIDIAILAPQSVQP